MFLYLKVVEAKQVYNSIVRWNDFYSHQMG